MDLLPDKFKIVCPQMDTHAFRCPGANKFGACECYTNAGVRAKVRTGCAFLELHKPVVEKKKTFINPLKASKKKVAEV